MAATCRRQRRIRASEARPAHAGPRYRRQQANRLTPCRQHGRTNVRCSLARDSGRGASAGLGRDEKEPVPAGHDRPGAGVLVQGAEAVPVFLEAVPRD